MAITKEQAITEREFHFTAACTPNRVERWRKNGVVKTWKTRPDQFQLPVKFGLYSYGYITESNAHEFHVASECPVQS